MRTIAELMNLRDRKALVVGGAGGVGSAVCETLQEMGAVVGILDLKGGKTGLSFICDLKNEEATGEATEKAISEMGGGDILVHCAAYVGETKVPGWSVPFENQTTTAWNDAVTVNLTSAFVLARTCWKSLEKSGNGSIILFSSIYGMVAPNFGLYEGTSMINPAAYNASKGGLLQLMRYLATLFAPKIRVNAISPGGIVRNYPEAFTKRYEAKTPLGRLAVDEDLKGAVAYLASDLSEYVTGHNLIIDGGWTTW